VAFYDQFFEDLSPAETNLSTGLLSWGRGELRAAYCSRK